MAEEPSNPACPEAERLRRLAVKITMEGLFLLWTVPLCMVMAKKLEQPEPTFLQWALMEGAAATTAGISIYLAMWVIGSRVRRSVQHRALTGEHHATHPARGITSSWIGRPERGRATP